MRRIMKKMICFLGGVVFLAGCSTLTEIPRSVAGASTRNLESARADSIYQFYTADAAACFNAVLEVAQKNEYFVFTKDEARGIIVLMDIKGYVDTTEVGVFITDGLKDGTRVELSSRSTPAKRAVAKVFFADLKEFLDKK
jgi:hypothetical protein